MSNILKVRDHCVPIYFEAAAEAVKFNLCEGSEAAWLNQTEMSDSTQALLQGERIALPLRQATERSLQEEGLDQVALCYRVILPIDLYKFSNVRG